MAVRHGYGKVATNGLVFAYDTGDTRNSYKGEPTTNLAPSQQMVNHGSYGHVMTFSEAPEKGPGWKKVNITYRGTNFRITQMPYIGQPTGTTYAYSIEIDWGSTTGYYMTGDGSSGFGINGGTTSYPHGTHTNSSGTTRSEGLFIYHNTYNVSCNDTIYYRYYQVEANSHSTPYTVGTRSATQGLLDLTGNSSIDLSNVSFDSNAQIVFDGSNDYINIPSSTVFDTQTVTVEVVVKPYATSQYGFWFEKGAVNTQYSLFIEGGSIVWRQASQSQYSSSSNLVANGWNHVVGTFKTGERKTYVNGVLRAEDSLVHTLATNQGNQFIGSYNSGGYHYNGEIAIVKVYNRVLTATEVASNYNHYKSRFNI